ncbi:MAG: hypothetical protein HN337_08320 [Deltaproteobacteria bacterium]|nr:hypothetical protein [Deltaproteobacteria bacterium]
MHPELLNNSLFLRYYSQWQKDPTSVVFVPIADYFMRYGLIEDATNICKQGVEKHPSLISGHIMMAKICIEKKEWAKAVDSVRRVLAIVPGHGVAMDLMNIVDTNRGVKRSDFENIKAVISTSSESVPDPTVISTPAPLSAPISTVEVDVKPETEVSVEPEPELETNLELESMPEIDLQSEVDTKLSVEADPISESEVELKVKTGSVQEVETKRPRQPSWETVTMANIYSAQGHHARAREIYEAILSREPENIDAKRGLEYLAKVDHP